MNAATTARRKAERQRRHRTSTGGLIARAHVEHEREVVESRTKQLQRSDEFLESLAKRTDESVLESLIERDSDDNIVTDLADGEINIFDFAVSTDETLPRDVIEIRGETTVRVKVGCPRCGAVGDEPCRKPNGRVADKAHAGRVTS